MAAVRYFTRNNQSKTSGHDGGGWDGPRDHVRTLRECDGNNEPLAEGDNDDNDDDKYDEDGNIPDDSAPPAESIARLHPESQCASVPSR
jgi:hypothetical protein